MAEVKDYLSALLQDNTIDNPKYTPAQYLEGIKAKLIALGAKPGTGEYENAFKSYIGIRNMNQGTFGGGGFEFSTAAKDALDYMKNKLTPAQVKELGIEPSGAFGGLGKEEAFVPGRTLQNPKTFETVNVADLDVIPDWFNPQSLPGFAEAGIKPGAKVTPAMQAKITELMGGQPVSNVGNAGNVPSTSGTAANVTPVTPATTTSTTGTTTTANAITPTLTTAQQTERVNAIASLNATFNAMGLGSEIASAVTDMVQKGYTTDTIMLIAQDPSSKDPVATAFQKRFSGNAARIKAGLAPLDPATYMANERAYRATMKAAGLPEGFYDSPDDFAKFIGNDVSPTELKTRVDIASDAISNADPFYVNSLKSMYGLTTGEMIAHALDPQAALPLLQKQASATKIGTAAARQGWGISATGAENLAQQGVTESQAAQGFRTVAGMQTEQQRLAEIWGGDAAAQGQNLVASTFGTAGAAYADQQIKALQAKEINAFSGGSGAGKGSLGIGVEQTGGNL